MCYVGFSIQIELAAVAGSVALFTHCQLSAMADFVVLNRRGMQEERTVSFLARTKQNNFFTQPLIHQPRAHTNAFQSSFVPSSVSVWNHLPHEALTAHSINSFKSLIAPLFLQTVTGYTPILAYQLFVYSCIINAKVS